MKKIKVFLKSKKYDAKGYYEAGSITVLKGSIICSEFKENYAYSPKVKAYRDSKEFVDENFVVKKDILFSSPSTASQFVLGYSSNGWKCWRTENKEYIEVLKEK